MCIHCNLDLKISIKVPMKTSKQLDSLFLSKCIEIELKKFFGNFKKIVQ